MKHNHSKEHKNSLEGDHMRKQLYNIHDEPNNSSKPLSEPKTSVSESDVHLFRTVYFAAKENSPNSYVNKLLNFLKASGVDPQFCDIHSDTVHDIQLSLLHVLDEEMKSELNQTKYYGLIIDESTDLSVHKKLVVYIRYVCPTDLDVKTKLLGNIRIPDGTANTIVTEVINTLKTFGLQTVNLVGLGSDGASVMFGKKGGVGVQLQKDAPMLVHVHCVAHRLSLACADAAKDFPYLMSFKDTLKNLYIHVNGSGVRTYKLEAMQDVMDEPTLKLKDPINIRWLALENAVKTIHKCYSSIVMYLQSNEGKNTVGDCIAEGLLKEVLHYKFPAFTAVLCDILTVVGILCKQLQSDSLDFSQFLPMKESTIGQLEGLINVNGKHSEEFKNQLSVNGSKIYFKGIQLTHANEKTQIEKLKKEYIQSVCENIENRMTTETSPILNAFSVLEPRTNELLDSSEVNENIKTLSQYYGLDEAALRREYSGISTLLKGSYRNISFKAFSKMIMRRHSEEYPLTDKLCHISLCIPVTSVPCERGFSLQNRIKVKSRTSLNPENLDMLMKLAVGPEIESFPYERAIRHWHREKRRRLARLYAPSKQ